MAKKVIFYCDLLVSEQEHLNAVVQQAILRHIGADEAVFLGPEMVRGFRSGINWRKLEQDGAVAVVILNVNEACLYGVTLEVKTCNLRVYEFSGFGGNKGYFFDCEELEVAGEKLIAVKGIIEPE